MPIQTSDKFSGPSSWLVLRERGGQLEIGVETMKKTILWLPEVRKFPFQHHWPLSFLMQQIYYQRSKCSLAFFYYFIFPQNHECLISWKAAWTNCSSTDYPFQSSGDMPHWVTPPVTCGQMGLCHSALFYLAGKYLYVGSTRSHLPWEWFCMHHLHTGGWSWITCLHGTSGHLAENQEVSLPLCDFTQLENKFANCRITCFWDVEGKYSEEALVKKLTELGMENFPPVLETKKLKYAL